MASVEPVVEDLLIADPSQGDNYPCGAYTLVLGQAGDDLLIGKAHRDVLIGRQGDDWLNGRAGDDGLLGGQGNDSLIGGAGSDFLLGGDGDDTLSGQAGNDSLFGGAGNDQLNGGAGQDDLNGGSGDDVLIDADVGDRFTGGRGCDEFRLGNGHLPNGPKITIFPPVPDFTITDFTVGEDLLTLNFGLTFDDLTFLDTEQGAIINAQNRGGLVLLEDVKAQDLTADSFRFADPEQVTRFQLALEKVLDDSNFPGISVSVMTPDGTTWTQAQGVSDLELQTPLTPDDRFVIGSITKLFTATTVLQLAEEGTLGLDDRMGQWLPDIAARIPHGDRISIRQLLGHTSGIRYYDEDAMAAIDANPELALQEWTPEDFIALIYDQEPLGEPGQFAYSNTNYELLGHIIEAATDNSLESLLHTRIFEPLGLQDTFYALPENIPGGYVKSYQDLDQDGVLENLLSQVHPSLSVKEASGGIVSTPMDLTDFAQALFSGELLAPESLQAMLETRNPFDDIEYGLGVMYDELPMVGRLQGHDGAQDIFGWRANLYHLPDLNMTVAITANSYSKEADPVDDLLGHIILAALE
mgnify:CR=1 FL=1